MRGADSELAEDRAAELGYREAGARELGLRDWYSLREPGSVAETPREFERLIGRLRSKKWAKENPERHHEHQLRWQRANRANEVIRVKAWRHRRKREAARVYTCAGPDCGVQWCRVPYGRLGGNKYPKYCSRKCFNRARYRRRAEVAA